MRSTSGAILDTARDEREICPTCGGDKTRFERICNTCWERLPEATKAALRIDDKFAESRIRKLIILAKSDVPLEDIVIYP